VYGLEDGRILGGSGDFSEEYGLLGSNAMQFGEGPMFRLNISLPSSGSKKPRKLAGVHKKLSLTPFSANFLRDLIF
jgi:hypothetical protein